jgi:membrane-anchored protein YejM (alkaline phosphatase superfamily)
VKIGEFGAFGFGIVVNGCWLLVAGCFLVVFFLTYSTCRLMESFLCSQQQWYWHRPLRRTLQRSVRYSAYFCIFLKIAKNFLHYFPDARTSA